MIEAMAVVACMGLYFWSLKRGPGGVGFDWVKFLAFLGMFVLFGAGFVAPLIASDLQTTHPNWFLGLLMGGILLFVLGITMWGLKRKKMRESV